MERLMSNIVRNMEDLCLFAPDLSGQLKSRIRELLFSRYEMTNLMIPQHDLTYALPGEIEEV
jgi:hypothetical protein